MLHSSNTPSFHHIPASTPNHNNNNSNSNKSRNNNSSFNMLMQSLDRDKFSQSLHLQQMHRDSPNSCYTGTNMHGYHANNNNNNNNHNSIGHKDQLGINRNNSYQCQSNNSNSNSRGTGNRSGHQYEQQQQHNNNYYNNYEPRYSLKVVPKQQYSHAHPNISINNIENINSMNNSMSIQQQQRQQKYDRRDIANSNMMIKSTIITTKTNTNNSNNNNNNNNNNNSSMDNINLLIYKMKKYLAITESLLHSPSPNTKPDDKLKKQGINTACELIQLINNYQYQSRTLLTLGNDKKQSISVNNSLNNTCTDLKLGQNKSMSASYHFPTGLAPLQLQNSNNSNNNNNNNNKQTDCFMRKISNLEQQKNYLQSLISQHERTNIKMFIQLNEGESQEIQKYKKLMAMLFDKYKQLEKLIQKHGRDRAELQAKLRLVSAQNKGKQQQRYGHEQHQYGHGYGHEEYSNKSIGKQNQKQSFKKYSNNNNSKQQSTGGCTKLCQLNVSQLKKKISNLEQLINEQNQCLSKALEQLQHLKKQPQKLTVSDLAKSTCSSEQALESHYFSNHSQCACESGSSYEHGGDPQVFANIKLNSRGRASVSSTNVNSNVGQNDMKHEKVEDQGSIYRFLLTQAGFIDSLLAK